MTASSQVPLRRPATKRQEEVRAHFDKMAGSIDRWTARNRGFHEADVSYLRFLIAEGCAVLDVGCGVGDTLAALKPRRGVGIDISPEIIARARTRHPDLEFHCGNAEDPADLAGISGPFDVILLSDTVGFLDDCVETLRHLLAFATPRTRIVVSYHSRLWEPILRLGESIGLKMPSAQHTWLSTKDTQNLLDLAGWEPLRREWRQLLPRRAFGLDRLINHYIAPLPGIRRFCLRNYIVARPAPVPPQPFSPSCTVLIPCRNERGNIEHAIRRLPKFAEQLEVIFVEGHSRDGTYEECLRVAAAYPDMDIKVVRQSGVGKGDAVRTGFDMAQGDVLMILDADLTAPPEELPKFYRALVAGKGEFINGSRLIYPMAEGAMRLLNWGANRAFAAIFSFLLNQRFTDTLCGTKVLWKRDYRNIVANRAYFGDFDPFGDFDLIFGAARLNLKILEIPVRYADRSYGETQISRFSHGWLLLRMVLFAWRKFKAV
jgi:SAM-dependent methyltransferase